MKETDTIRSVAEEWKKSKVLSFLKGALIVALTACIGCFTAYQIVGAHVAPDGTLVEPFALIPLFYFFGLLALAFGILLAVVHHKHTQKRK